MGSGATASAGSRPRAPSPSSQELEQEAVRPVGQWRSHGSEREELGASFYHERSSIQSWASDEVSMATSDTQSTVEGYTTMPMGRFNDLRPPSASPATSPGTLPSVAQKERVQHCLSLLQSSLDVSFDADAILPHVRLMVCQQNERVLPHGEEGVAVGILVVDEGALEVLSPSGDVVLNRLLPGEFCGELSALFGIQCSAAVVAAADRRTRLLYLPAQCVRDNMEGELDEAKTLGWCAMRSYVDTTSLFAPGTLSQRATALCMKASPEFSAWSKECVNHIATCTVPVMFSRGEMIYCSGEESCQLFFILRGPVEMSRGGQEVNRRDVRTSDEGYCIGSREVLLGELRGCSARAIGAVLLVPVSRDTILEAVTQYPSEIERLRELIEWKRSTS